MRVLYVGHVPPPINGSTIMGEVLMMSLQAGGVRMKAVEIRMSRDNEEYEKVSFRKILMMVSIMARLAWQCVVWRPERVILCPAFNSTSMKKDIVLAFMAIRVFRVPAIFWCHGRGLTELMRSLPAVVSRSYRALLAGAQAVVPVSDHFREELSGFVPPERIKVIHNGIAARKVVREPAIDGPVRVLYLSTMDTRKGWRELLDVAVDLVARGTAAEFVFAGPPGNISRQQIEEEFVKAGHRSRIRYLGPVYGAEKDALFDACDVFCLPSFYPYESFPVAILEAMRSGAAIIGTRHAGIPEAFEHGKGGFIVEKGDLSALGNAVGQLVADGRLRHAMGQANQARFEERFSIDAFARKWMAVLDDRVTARP